MSVRFRVRTPGGQELSFASVEMFEDFVRSGDLSDDDLVYDAQDGSWAPARTHPIVLDIQYEDERAEDEQAEDEAGSDEAASSEDPGPDNAFGLSLAPAQDSTDDEEASAGSSEASSDAVAQSDESGEDSAAPGPAFGLDLAMPEELSAEEARQQFLEKLEAERADEMDFGMDEGMSGFRMETSGAMADLVAPEPAPPPPPPPPAAEKPTPRPPSEPRPPRERRPSSSKPSAPSTTRPAGGGGGSKLLLLVIVIAVLGGGGYVGFRFVSGGDEAVTPPEPEIPVEEIPVETVPVEAIPVEAEPEPAPEPVIANTESAVRERARERFLTATQAAFRDLPGIPESWPGGAYLTTPSAHPDVLSTWEAYLTTIRSVRADDDARYATAYESALDDALIEGDERTTRLEAALADQQASAEARNAHYDRVEALASAAIQSHNALLGAEGLLIFDGTVEGVAAGPVGAGVSGRDEDSTLLLQQVSDLLSDLLEAEGMGPGSGENVRAWVWDGFLDAVTN